MRQGGFVPYTLNLGGRLIEISEPQVWGILNVTPDSFYADSRCADDKSVATRARQIVAEGGSVIDVGGCSTRPGGEVVGEDEELRRVLDALAVIRSMVPDMPVSIDTYRASVARECVERYGSCIINDVSGGADSEMFATVARLGVPYVLTHSGGIPPVPATEPKYNDVTGEVLEWLARRIDELHLLGVCDVIADPGFGFAKTLEHNYALLSHMAVLQTLDVPVLVGVSRKSMIYKALRCSPEESLGGTTIVHTLALEAGAQILRAHDVKAAREAIGLCTKVRMARLKRE